MVNINDLGEVISTDVLIVGGGIGGVVAAIKAKEDPVDVLVVDKATVGWAGKAPKGHGVLWNIAPGDDADKFIEYHVRNVGCYLNDQELFYSYARDSYSAVGQLAEWGVKIVRDANGEIETTKHMFIRDCSIAVADIDMMLPLRAKARKMGAKILNKVQIIDLLVTDGRVVGAVGFNIIDGRFYIVKAKATILANGGCSYKLLREWGETAGEGIAAAYRAGAEMRNAEFGNAYSLYRRTGTHCRAEYPYIVNALGENIFKRYVGGWEEDACLLALGMEKEVNEGRGPLFVDFSQRTQPLTEGLVDPRTQPLPAILHKRAKFVSWNRRLDAKVQKYGGPSSSKPEVILGFIGSVEPIKVDYQMKTTLPGLWAIGDTSDGGSSWLGAQGMMRIGGHGLMHAVMSGLRAGSATARFASEDGSPEINGIEVKGLKETMFAPLHRDKGLSPDDVMYPIQETVNLVKYSLRRSKDRLEEGLNRIKEVQERLPELCAKDGHGLVKCHETESMALCAEMVFRAALMRTESRGWHYREDYPERDDKNWLKWVIVKQDGERMVTSTEPIPIDTYKFKP